MHNKDPITLLVAYKDNQKACEIDITPFTDRQVAEIILVQDAQGRSWSYEFTNLREMRERRGSYE